MKEVQCSVVLSNKVLDSVDKTLRDLHKVYCCATNHYPHTNTEDWPSRKSAVSQVVGMLDTVALESSHTQHLDRPDCLESIACCVTAGLPIPHELRVVCLRTILESRTWKDVNHRIMLNIYGSKVLTLVRQFHKSLHSSKGTRGKAAGETSAVTEGHNDSMDFKASSFRRDNSWIQKYPKNNYSLRQSQKRGLRNVDTIFSRKQLHKEIRRKNRRLHRKYGHLLGKTSWVGEDDISQSTHSVSQEVLEVDLIREQFQNTTELARQNLDPGDGKKSVNPNNSVPNKYPCKFRLATLNSHGPKFTEIIHLMKTEKLDILAVQETMISTNSKFQLGDYMFVTSTNVKDPIKPPQCQKGKLKPKPNQVLRHIPPKPKPKMGGPQGSCQWMVRKAGE